MHREQDWKMQLNIPIILSPFDNTQDIFLLKTPDGYNFIQME